MTWFGKFGPLAALLPITLAACIGSIGDGDGTTDGDTGTDSSAFACDPEAGPSISPMRRLSHDQFTNTLSDVLTQVTDGEADAIMAAIEPSIALVPIDKNQDYRRIDQDGTQAHVDGYYDVAIAVAEQLTANSTRLTNLAGNCATDGDNSNDTQCVREFVESFGMLALRRTLVEDEIIFYSGDAYDDDVSVDPESFAERITVLLLAPEFLNHIEDELPAGDDDDLFALAPFELAARLSYHFWDSMPDPILMAAAADGSLATEDGYIAQVDRLFNHARTKEIADNFYGEWLRVDDLPPMDGSNGTPAYDAYVAGDVPGPDLTDNMITEVLDLFRHYTWNTEGDLDGVLLSNLSFAKTDDLAKIYGVEAWTEGNEPPQLSEGERGGLITRAALVATGSTSTRPVMKGKLIREHILCDELPPPPADIGDLPELTADMTVREQLEELTMQTGSSCIACHTSMNPLGFATENYDAIGRFRVEEAVYNDDGSLLAQKPVDTVAEPRVTSDDERSVDSGMQLSELIVESGKANKCIARHYFRFAYGRHELEEKDGCVLESFRSALVEGGSLSAMLRDVALQSEFKLRKRGE
jgi:hypothetical protein